MNNGDDYYDEKMIMLVKNGSNSRSFISFRFYWVNYIFGTLIILISLSDELLNQQLHAYICVFKNKTRKQLRTVDSET